MKFKEYLKLDGLVESTEGQSAQISFLTHLEELAIQNGKEGFDIFEDHITNFLNFLTGLSSKIQVGLKIDGNPSVYFGQDPRPGYNKQFFVATKSAFSLNNPKINHSKEEIIQNYGDIPLSDKLMACFDAFSVCFLQLPNKGHISTIYQGDLLFSLPVDKQIANINGTDFLTFKPNIIVYAVPVDQESEVYQRILKANVGIILHEIFKAEVINKGQAIRIIPKSKDFEEIKEIGKINNVFIEDSVHSSGNLHVSTDKRQIIDGYLQKCRNHMSETTDSFDKEWKTSPLLNLLKSYLNFQIKTTGGIFKKALKRVEFDDKRFKQGFRAWLNDKFIDEAGKKITDKGKISTLARRDALFEWIDQNVHDFNHLLHATYLMLLIKNEFLIITNEMERKLGKTFYHNPDGSYEVTGGEGFVLFTGNSKVKLVDRIAFSQRNFNKNLTESVDNSNLEGWQEFGDKANAKWHVNQYNTFLSKASDPYYAKLAKSWEEKAKRAQVFINNPNAKEVKRTFTKVFVPKWNNDTDVAKYLLPKVLKLLQKVNPQIKEEDIILKLRDVIEEHRANNEGEKMGSEFWEDSVEELAQNIEDILTEGYGDSMSSIDKKFNDLANQQRGEPESKMLAATMFMGGGVINPVLEHTGDLTHRMAQYTLREGRGWGYVKEKVDRVLRYLTYPYGFTREFEENIINNAKFRGMDPKVFQEKLFSLMQEYADAHKKLPVYNNVQKMARDAAVAVGERRFYAAEGWLDQLKKVLDQGEEVWEKEASKFVDQINETYYNPNKNEPLKDRLGRCYELAGRFANHNEGSILVHGSIEGFGNPRINHAWVILDPNTIWEPTGNKEWLKDVFENVFHPVEDDRFTSTQANINLLKHMNWGPWN